MNNLFCSKSLQHHILKHMDEYQKQQPQFFCSTKQLTTQAQTMQNAFCGEVVYAVKANPHPKILTILSNAGINTFEVASIREAELVKEVNPNARILFNNPIKTPFEIKTAWSKLGLKHYTVQSKAEIDKILHVVDGVDLTKLEIAVRLKAPDSSNANINHSHKFGVSAELADQLCHYLVQQGVNNLTISVHLGSANPSSSVEPYRVALQTMIALADHYPEIGTLNLGGGFPANFYRLKGHEEQIDIKEMMSDLSAMIQKTIPQNRSYHFFIEPGLSLVAESTVLVTPVVYLDQNIQAIYIRDGIYGSYTVYNTHDYNHLSGVIIRRQNNQLQIFDENCETFTVFGQTCDGGDRLTMNLPRVVRENDMIGLMTAGAYMGSVSTRFNGFSDVSWVFY